MTEQAVPNRRRRPWVRVGMVTFLLLVKEARGSRRERERDDQAIEVRT